MTEHTDEPTATGTAALLFEARELAELPRTGWRYDGVPLAVVETVADHSHSSAVIGLVLAAMEGADPGRTALLCVLHDLPETRTGDQTPVTRRYVTAADPRGVAADQVAAAHPDVQSVVLGAIGEFEDDKTLEARCAHDADKLDCYLQALRLLRLGYPVGGKARRCREALETASAQRLAAAAATMDPAQWQHDLLRVPAAR
ncbi:haloacid dehalogenase [Kitasatospora herbaricolor]|uniref:HD domain-containing protein n=1 Tax=Kitasatospora herbaricolor TaxID=68217 RepID=UPI001748A377|nr:HD domain-containing protein [Kitasatospora herbaricolor]MDQ0305760.1 putative hydrolase of HD superfamily [Kitasatospora herbaricolor]GGV26955.1 haloacid dehalogenase [Kitasatospora herbaricolor]